MRYQVICFGEVLWDLLPSGPIAGGAPMNVAFQLNQLGVQAGMISRIGHDVRGKELTAFLASKQIPLHFIQTDFAHQTGIVNVTLDVKGSPSYEIVQQVAWDHISAPTETVAAVAEADLFVFGSLAARNSASRASLFTYLNAAKKRAFDINLRAPYFDKDLIETLLNQSDIVKMNDEELEIIANWLGIQGDQGTQIRDLYSRYDLEILAVTRGAHGAAICDGSGIVNHSGYKVTVQDTIGSGDAFFAGFISQWLKGNDTAACLDFACKMGAYVATRKGGTPELTMQTVEAAFP